MTEIMQLFSKYYKCVQRFKWKYGLSKINTIKHGNFMKEHKKTKKKS